MCLGLFMKRGRIHKFLDCKKKGRVRMLVSIVVPIYNTEKYLRKCIDSLVHQSYENIEVVLVDDGSTDSSLSISMEYRNMDDRVKVFSKQNGGQGTARNLGIEKALGDYIMFVDADDWVDSDIVEVLVNEINTRGSDIAICNIKKTKFNSEEIGVYFDEKLKTDVVEGEYKKQLFDISTYPVARLINKKLFAEHSLFFPTHFYEDVALLPLIYAHAERISFVDKHLYTYRDQGNSTVNNLNHIYDRVECLETLVDRFKQYGKFALYESDIIAFLNQRCQVNLRMVKTLLDRKLKDFEEVQNNVMKKLGSCGVKIPRVAVFGSYSLMLIGKKVMALEDAATVGNYYGGESIISVMDEKNDNINSLRIVHKNPYRYRCLVNDFGRKFSGLNPGEFVDIDYILVDFLEERYSIGVYKEEKFTLSEAFGDISSLLDIEYRVMEIGKDEWKKCWSEACDKFIELLDRYVGNKKVILVKMMLAEKCNNDKEKVYYKDIAKIKEINNCLQWCYDYFQRKCPEASIIDVNDMESYYTDINYRHGCYPWHLNEKAYGDIKEKVVNIIDNLDSY